MFRPYWRRRWWGPRPFFRSVYGIGCSMLMVVFMLCLCGAIFLNFLGRRF